jgi:hypothetical protein
MSTLKRYGKYKWAGLVVSLVSISRAEWDAGREYQYYYDTAKAGMTEAQAAGLVRPLTLMVDAQEVNDRVSHALHGSTHFAVVTIGRMDNGVQEIIVATDNTSEDPPGWKVSRIEIGYGKIASSDPLPLRGRRARTLERLLSTVKELTGNNDVNNSHVHDGGTAYVMYYHGGRIYRIAAVQPGIGSAGPEEKVMYTVESVLKLLGHAQKK